VESDLAADFGEGTPAEVSLEILQGSDTFCTGDFIFGALVGRGLAVSFDPSFALGPLKFSVDGA
jgi:hypothetical protein